MGHNKARKLNVLYLGPYGLGSGLGGSARLRNMLDVLKKLGASIHLISYVPWEKFSLRHEKIDDNLDITRISVNKASPKFLKAFALGLVFASGLRHIRQKDFVFSHSPGSVYGFTALILAKAFGKPLIIDLTDVRDPDTPEFIYRYVLRKASVVFAVSRYLAEAARRAGSRNVVHMPGFIDASFFRFSAPERMRIRKSLNIGDSEIVIGYSGAFLPIEGLSFLIKAFGSLYGRYHNIKLVLLGGRNVPGSEDIPGLVSSLDIEGRVIFVPPQPYQLVPAYLSAFDIACSPKIDCEENRAADPIRVYEYMSAQLPTVATAVSSTATVIENGQDGFLVRPGDEHDLERALEHVIQNLGSLSDLRRRAREKVIDNYTQEIVLKTLQTNLARIREQRG